MTASRSRRPLLLFVILISATVMLSSRSSTAAAFGVLPRITTAALTTRSSSSSTAGRSATNMNPAARWRYYHHRWHHSTKRGAVALLFSTSQPSSSTSTHPSASNNSRNDAIKQQQTRRSSSSSSSTAHATTSTGGLRRLPMVKPRIELINRAKKDCRKVHPDKTIQNAKLRARKHGAERLNQMMLSLCLPLRDVVRGYRRKRLHPFEQVVADLTAAARKNKDGLTLDDVLNDLHEARKMLLDHGKDWIAKVKQAETAREAGESLEEGMVSMLDLFEQVASPVVSQMVDLQKTLRRSPIVNLESPAVVLVGSPNVGKSSIVRHISSGRPEINNYPFTTRGMTMGHVEVFWSNALDTTSSSQVAKANMPEEGEGRRKKSRAEQDEDLTGLATGRYAYSEMCQIMDSPGLLVRESEDQRNEMEALTVAAMQHLPTAVCCVMDFSGQAGDNCSSIKDQLQIRRQIRARFPRRPWIDVVSKIDLGVEEWALTELQEILDSEPNAKPYLLVSVQDGQGVDELRTELLHMLGEVRVVLDAMAAVEKAA